MADRADLPTRADTASVAVVDPPPAAGPAADRAAAADDLAEARDRRRRSAEDALRRARRLLVAVSALAVLAVGVAVVMVLQAQELRAAEADRVAVREAGELIALRVTTFDGPTIDEWVTDTQSLATRDYAEEVALLFDDTFRAALAENQVSSVGEVLQSFVQDVDGDSATVFALVRQTYTSASQTAPIADQLRMEIELARGDDGTWLADEVAILGPSTFAAPEDAGADGEAGETPADPAAEAPADPAAEAPAEPADGAAQ